MKMPLTFTGAGSGSALRMAALRISGALVLLSCPSCAHEAIPAVEGPGRELVMSYDDNRPSANLAFPNLSYESLIRYQLPPGKHRPLRLRVLLANAGSLEITLYTNDLFEAPAEAIHKFTWTVAPGDVSTGRDGHWVVADLRMLDPLEGVIWIGVRKLGGEPTVWTSATSSGQTFLRDRSPGNSMGILPVKRTPMVRLELML